MTVKRSRTRTSSFCHVSAANTKVMKTDGEEDNTGDSSSSSSSSSSRPTILTVASPVSAAARYEHGKIGGFLEVCHYCKKRLDPNSEIFMYSNLRAFCSRECREYQIAEDQSQAKEMTKGKMK